jgi:uncharacterized protein (TIGR02145 family)
MTIKINITACLISVLMISKIIGCDEKTDIVIDKPVVDDGMRGVLIDARDGKTYQTVKIGHQTWMAENLNYVAGSRKRLTSVDSTYAETYGQLYDWKTACKVCPTGWHLPNDAEWSELVDYLGGASVAGGKLKAVDTVLWTQPNVGSINSSGFSALPAGLRSLGGVILNNGAWTSFWSATGYDATFSRSWELIYKRESIFHNAPNKEYGHSVRCVKD